MLEDLRSGSLEKAMRQMLNITGCQDWNAVLVEP
jgi:hypothetical protein